MNASCFFSAATRNRARPISMNYFVSPRRTKVKVLAALRIKRPEKKRAKEGKGERERESGRERSPPLREEGAYRSWLSRLKAMNAIDFTSDLSVRMNEKSRPSLYASSLMVDGNDCIPTPPLLLPPTRDPLKKSVEDR